MSSDRFIRWGKPPEWGPPTLERLAAVARDYLGESWDVATENGCWIYCRSNDKQSFPLRSERNDPLREGSDQTFGEALHAEGKKWTRGFRVFFLIEDDKIKQTSVITNLADEFTGNVADGYAKLIARWWNGKVEWPT